MTGEMDSEHGLFPSKEFAHDQFRSRRSTKDVNPTCILEQVPSGDSPSVVRKQEEKPLECILRDEITSLASRADFNQVAKTGQIMRLILSRVLVL